MQKLAPQLSKAFARVRAEFLGVFWGSLAEGNGSLNSRDPEIFCHIEGTHLIGRVDLATDRSFLIRFGYEVPRAADSGLESTKLRF